MVAERKNTGLAVAHAKRLNDCFHELTEAIASRPAAQGDRDLWQYDYAALPGGPEGAEREVWNHRCGSNDVALITLRGAVTRGNLQLWTRAVHGEAAVDRHELKELTFRTFKTGIYQPDNRRIDCGLADTPLWVKDADWHRYMLDLWALRYGADSSNPAPPAEPPRLPPQSPFILLSQALTWVAFRVSMDRDHLHEVLSLDSYGGRVPQEAIKDALAHLIALGSGGKVAFHGKYRASLDDDEKTLLTAPIDPIKLEDYRLFSYLEDELGHGEGLLFWRNPDGTIIDRILGTGRKDSFFQVKVNRADLLREFPPQRRPQAKGFKYPLGHTYTRADPADIAPWWTVNQALAWIASRTPSYVDYAGRLEDYYSANHPDSGRLMAHVTIEDDMSRCEEASAFMLERRATWAEGSVLAHAGRALLEQVQSGAMKPAASESGKGRPMAWHEFAGLGSNEAGGDWLDLEPRPLFSSAEIMRVFPASDLSPAGAGGGKVPSNRQLDHENIRDRARAMLEEQPGLSIGSAAASIVAELPPNPKTSKPRDARGIEKLIAHLWEGK